MPSEDSPASDHGLPAFDWAAERARLVEEGDLEGVAILDGILSRPANYQRPLDRDLLAALANRRSLRKTRAELQPCIDADASTPVGVCNRWNLLAPWADRFARTSGARRVINFGIDGGSPGPVTAARMYPPKQGELPAPELAWAEAFRDATQALVHLVLDEDLDDVVVQALVRDIEEILDGRAVEVATHVREVELIVKTLLGRLTKPAPIPTALPSPPHGPIPETPLRATLPLPDLDKIEQAIALLLRDGRHPRSMRQYAKEVGLSHTTLGRDDRWRTAYEVAESLAQKDKADLPTGEKDKEGNLEVEAPLALCENCRQEPIWKAVVVNGESMGLCEKCAAKPR